MTFLFDIAVMNKYILYRKMIPMNNKTITTISIIAVLGILAIGINSNAFAQNSIDTAPGDQPIGNGTVCHTIHGNGGAFSECDHLIGP